jgi:hypothetical protein
MSEKEEEVRGGRRSQRRRHLHIPLEDAALVGKVLLFRVQADCEGIPGFEGNETAVEEDHFWSDQQKFKVKHRNGIGIPSQVLKDNDAQGLDCCSEWLQRRSCRVLPSRRMRSSCAPFRENQKLPRWKVRMRR